MKKRSCSGLQPIFLFFHSFVNETSENLGMYSCLHISMEVYNLHFLLSLRVSLGNLHTGKTIFYGCFDDFFSIVVRNVPIR